jgi:flagellar basal-body rod protein FlgB
MALDQIPLFSMLKGRLGYISQRERVIAQNVANSDTPGFMPKDLKPFTLPPGVGSADGAQMVTPTITNAGHMGLDGQSGAGAVRTFTSADTPDSETTLDGNHVVLEDQMMKMTEARLDYDTAIGFYQKSLAMLRLAARAPGK